MDPVPQELRTLLESVPEDYAELHEARTEANLRFEQSEKFERDIDRFISLLPKNLPELTKAALLYDVLRRTIRYDNTENEVRYTGVAAFYRQSAVCMGIAELYRLLCRRYGLLCEIAIGYAGLSGAGGGGLHAWNQLRLSGRWYQCDLTWDLNSADGERHFFLRSDKYLKDHDHYWLPERLHPCPRDFGTVPRLPTKGVDLACLTLRRATRSK